MVCIIDNAKHTGVFPFFNTVKVTAFTVLNSTFAVLNSHGASSGRIVKHLIRRRFKRCILLRANDDRLLTSLRSCGITVEEPSLVYISKASLAIEAFLVFRIKNGLRNVVAFYCGERCDAAVELLYVICPLCAYLTFVSKSIDSYTHLGNDIYTKTGASVLFSDDTAAEPFSDLNVYLDYEPTGPPSCAAVSLYDGKLRFYNWEPEFCYQQTIQSLSCKLGIDPDFIAFACGVNYVDCCRIANIHVPKGNT